MSETMIRRVSRAICCPPYGSGCAAKQDTNGYAVCQAHTFEVDARAAIEAMREPTEAMLEAGANRWETHHPGATETYPNERATWRAMVDAASTPPPSEAPS